MPWLDQEHHACHCHARTVGPVDSAKQVDGDDEYGPCENSMRLMKGAQAFEERRVAQHFAT